MERVQIKVGGANSFAKVTASSEPTRSQRMQSPLFKRPSLSHQDQHKTVSQSKHVSTHHVVDLETGGQGERLSRLHNRLQLEAEKIRKWKTSTEMELQMKENRLKEANTTIENQRQSLVDLQLQNSSLHSRLCEEEINQHEIEHRLFLTRNICTALKEHIERVQDNIAQAEKDKVELVQQDKERFDQYQELLEQFKSLELEKTKETEELKGKLQSEQDDKAALLADLHSRLSIASGNLQSLEREHLQSQLAVTQLKEELEKKTSEFASLKSQALDIEQSSKKKEVSLASKISELESTRTKLKQREEEALDLQTRLDISKHALLSVEAELKTASAALDKKEVEYKARIEDLTSEISTLKGSVSDVEEECKRMEGTKEDLLLQVDHLKSTISELESARRVLQERMDMCDSEKDKIKSENTALEEKLKCALLGSKDLEQEKKKLQEEVSKIKKSAENSLEEKEDLLSDKVVLVSELEVVKALLKQKEDDIELVKEQLCQVLHQHSESCKKLRGLAEVLKAARMPHTDCAEIELMVLADFICESVVNLQHNSEVYQSKTSNLSKQLEVVVQENADLRSAVEKAREQLAVKQDMINAHLTEQEQAGGMLSSKLAEIALLTSKVEEVQVSRDKVQEELQELNEHLKAQLASEKDQCVQLNAKLAQLVSKLEESEHIRASSESQLSEYTSLVDGLQGKCQSLQEELSKKTEEVLNMKEMVVQSEKLLTELKLEEEQSRQDHSQQISELANTLHLYKVENEKVVEQKDSEISDLKGTIKELESELQDISASTHKCNLLKAEEDKRVLLDQLEQEKTLNSDLKEKLTSLQASLSEPVSHKMCPFKVPSTPNTHHSTQNPMGVGQLDIVCGSQPTDPTHKLDGRDRRQVWEEENDMGVGHDTPQSPTTTTPQTLRDISNLFTPRQCSTPKEIHTLSSLAISPSNTRKVPPSPSNTRKVPPSPSNARKVPPSPSNTRKVPPSPSNTHKVTPSPSNTRKVPPSPSNTGKTPSSPNIRRAPQRGFSAHTNSSYVQIPELQRDTKMNLKSNMRWMDTSKKSSSAKPSKQPRQRKSRKEVPVRGMSWFDQDDVFGFTPED